MSEMHGVRSASRLVGTTTTTLYVETAKQNIRAKVDPKSGELLWDSDDLVRLRVMIAAKREAEAAVAQARRDAAFRRANPKR